MPGIRPQTCRGGAEARKEIGNNALRRAQRLQRDFWSVLFPHVACSFQALSTLFLNYGDVHRYAEAPPGEVPCRGIARCAFGRGKPCHYNADGSSLIACDAPMSPQLCHRVLSGEALHMPSQDRVPRFF
jgi:hypothetical protein